MAQYSMTESEKVRARTIYEWHNEHLVAEGELAMPDLDQLEPDVERAVLSLINYTYEEAYEEAEDYFQSRYE